MYVIEKQVSGGSSLRRVVIAPSSFETFSNVRLRSPGLVPVPFVLL